MKSVSAIGILIISILALAMGSAMANSKLSPSRYFIENIGQNDLEHTIKYYLKTNEHGLFIRSNGISYTTETENTTQRIDLTFVGASPRVLIKPIGLRPASSYFYTTSELSQKAARQFDTIKYINIYEQIDLLYYVQANGNLKYEFVVKAGGNHEDINISYSGIGQDLAVDQNGVLNIPSISGNISEAAPMTFYENGDTIPSRYKAVGTSLQFVLDRQRKHETLIIDPEIVWSTYHGGTQEDVGRSIGYDSSFNVYILGHTKSVQFPVSAGAHQKDHKGNNDFFISKFDSTGSLVWSTYLGGLLNEQAEGISVTDNGDVHIIGTTTSANLGSGIKSHQHSKNSASDAFLAKLDTRGQLQWTTYFGGNSADFGRDIATNEAGDIFIVGFTKSLDFETTPNAYQTKFADTTDGFISKFNADGKLIWSTYFGGKGIDQLDAIHVGKQSNLYIAGRTSSLDFPVENGLFQDSLSGQYDACIARFDSSGQVIWSTLFGGAAADAAKGIVTDINGDVYITGSTASPDLYISGSDTLQDTLAGGNSDAFVLKLKADGRHQWSTFYGGTGEDVATSIDWYHTAVLITGYTNSDDLEIYHQADKKPLQEKKRSGYDGFHANINIHSGKLYVSSYMGGNGNDYLYDGKFYYGGQIMVGSSRSTDFRTSLVSQQKYKEGKSDAIAAAICPDVFKKITYPFCSEDPEIQSIQADDFEASYPITYQWQIKTLFSDWKDLPGQDSVHLPRTTVKQRTFYRRIYKAGMCRDTSLFTTVYYGPIAYPSFTFNNDECTPDTVRFKNTTTISSGKFTQVWRTQKTSATSFDFEHYYKKSGGYTAILIVTADSGCVRRSFGNVRMRKIPEPRFKTIAACNKDSVVFMNTSISDSPVSVQWDLGDGSKTSLDSFRHPYAKKGRYTIKLRVESLFGCVDSMERTIQVDSIIFSRFSFSNSCPGDSVPFHNNSKRGVDSLLFEWSFGDDSTSKAREPKHVYQQNGTYHVTLVTKTLTGCYDTMSQPITIVNEPKAIVSYRTSCLHDTTHFKATFINPHALYRYQWLPGDGGAIKDQTEIGYLYPRYGQYKAIFKATVGEEGCERTWEIDVLHDSLLKAQFEVDDICENEMANFRNTSALNSGTIEWQWDFGKNQQSSLKNPAGQSYKPGNYQIVLIAKSSTGCADTFYKSIKVSAMPKANFFIRSACFGDPVTITNLSDLKGEKLKSYEWNFGGRNTSQDENPRYTYGVGNRNYTIALTVENTDGCKDALLKPYYQYGTILIGSEHIRDATCYDKPDGYAVVIATGGAGNLEYEWQTDPKVESRTLEDVAQGTYTVKVTDSMGCSATRNISIESPAPVTITPFRNKEICRGDLLEIRGEVTGGTAPYEYFWQCDRSNCHVWRANDEYLTVGPKYKTTYTLRVQDSRECHAQPESIDIIPLNPKKVDAGPTLYAVDGVPIQLNANADTTGNYSWTPQDHLDNPDQQSPWATIHETTNFKVTFTSDGGCKVSDTVTVVAVKGFDYASAFTPNGDGVNDGWEIRKIGFFPNCEVSIFNRWGGLIYQSIGYSRQWYGDKNGNKLPAGTYYYVIDLNNGSKPFTGPVTILE